MTTDQIANICGRPTTSYPDFPELVLVDGVKGLAAVDPEWDGSELFNCSDPDCRRTHNSDWNTHDNLWKKANV